MTKFYRQDSNFAKKVEELFNKMEELGLSITYDKIDGFIIEDEHNTAFIKDVECFISDLDNLPPIIEYALIPKNNNE